MLNSLQITNFRTFRNLCLNRLGKVNLIVGRNNVGKTSLLEAVHLYSSDNVVDAVVPLLQRRQEYSLEKDGGIVLFNNLFYRDAEDPAQIQIGETTGDNQLVIRPRIWRRNQKLMEILNNFYMLLNTEIPLKSLETKRLVEIAKDELIAAKESALDAIELEELEEIEANELLTAKRGTEATQFISIKSYNQSQVLGKERELKDSFFLPFSGFDNDSIDPAELWDRVVLSDREDAVLDALKVIQPDLERIVMVQGKRSERLAMVKLVQQKNMPLRSLGDGMNKLFELALGLVNTGEGRAFLVDEIDSGLHFTTLVDVWRLVFRTAEKLNVQVFATTHSWDCIEAFQKAASEHPDDGLLIRLERSEADVTAELFSDEDLTIITRESIEVR